MPRIRTIKPEFWTSERLGTLLPGADGRQARLLFIALWNLAEDHGVCRAAPAYLRGAAFVYDEDVTSRDVERWLSMLEAGGFIVRYSDDGSSLLWVRGFDEHQKIDRKSKATLREPSSEEKGRRASPRRALDEPSLLEGKGREGSGMEGNSALAREAPQTPAVPAPAQHATAGAASDAETFAPPPPAGPVESLPDGVDRVHRTAKGAPYALSPADVHATRQLLALANGSVPEILRRWENGLRATYGQRVNTLAKLADREKWEGNLHPEKGREAKPPPVTRGSVRAEGTDHSKTGELEF